MKELIRCGFIEEFEIDFNSQINIFYGQNDVGKTRLLEYLQKILKQKELSTNDEHYDILLVDEIPDFKKEIDLTKKSILRTKLKNLIFNQLEKNNDSFENEINAFFEKLNLNEKINKLLNINYEKYKITHISNANNLEKFIDYFFELKATKINSDDLEEDISLSLSTMKKLYYESLIFNKEDLKNNIILFDCPETLFDKSSYQLLTSKLNNLIKNNNKLIITTRDSYFLKFFDLNFDNYFFIFGNKIKKINFDEKLLILYKTIIEFEKKEYNNFDLLHSQVKLVYYSEDKKKDTEKFKQMFFESIPFINFEENKINIDHDKQDFYTSNFFLFLKFVAKNFEIKIINFPILKFKALVEIDF